MEQEEKKKKGRPKKANQEELTQEKSADAADTETAQEKKPSRRAGRPKKAADADIKEEKAEAETNTGEVGGKTEAEPKRRTKKSAAAEKTDKEIPSDEKAEGKKTAAAAKKTSSKGSRKKKSEEALPEEKQEVLAIESHNRLALEGGEKKQLPHGESKKELPQAKEKKSLPKAKEKKELPQAEEKKILPEAEEKKQLPEVDHTQKVPAHPEAKDIVPYEKGQLVAVDGVRTEEPKVEPKSKSGSGKKRSQRKKQKEAKDSKEQKEQKERADFVAGVNGIVENNGEESLSAFGEQAGLGVLGVIEEAPVVEAVLPLVQESEKTGKKSRKRGRKKKSQKQVEPAVQDFDVAPIVEDGELARIEAEESLKAVNKAKETEKSAKKEHVRRVLYVSSVPDEQAEVVITENGIVSEYFIEMAHQSKIRGNIYKGVINNVDTNLQAVFVNFGGGKNGFLQIDEVHPEYYLSPHDDASTKYPPIQKVLKVGQEILVQVVKEPNGSKGAFLTTWLSLAGRYLVLTPGQEQVGVSRKVEDNEERQRLRALLNGIKPGENMGVIIRTASEGASKANIQKDLQLLKRTWKNIQKLAVKSSAPSLLYQEADLATRAVRDYLNENIDEVWVDSKDVQKSVAELIKVLFPKNKEMLHLHEDSRQSLWERFNIARQLEEVTKREVNLPSGGRLVFDQTEALMAIDINSGKSQGKSNFEAMVYRTNMEAVEAIARHLRLRDIGGQIVIDFIEMRDKSHCREVEKALNQAMKNDRARHDIGKMSSFGLLELVRQRTGSSAISITSEPCPHCRGTGFRRNLEWQAQGVLRDIKSKLAAKNVPSTYVHHVEQEIAFYLLNKKRDRLSELEQEFGVKVEIHLK